MARIRSLKPEFWTDRSLARKLSRDARMLYLGLWNLADEHGRLNGDAYYIKGQIFPYDDDLTPGAINNLIDELDDAGKAIRYAANGDPYLFLPTLARHQRLEGDKVPSRLPEPPDVTPVTPEWGTPLGSSVNEVNYSTGHPNGYANGVVADPTTRDSSQVTESTQADADLSESRADSSAPDADSSTLLYVAGSMEHVVVPPSGTPSGTPSGPRPNGAKPEPLAPLAGMPPDFEDFWEHWPRKVSKADAKKAFAKAVGKNRQDPAVIVATCKSYADRCRATGQDPNFIPYPATWLNRESWEDNLDEVMPLGPNAIRDEPPRPLPDWCGKCDFTSRTAEQEPGRWANCSDCHPNAERPHS